MKDGGLVRTWKLDLASEIPREQVFYAGNIPVRTTVPYFSYIFHTTRWFFEFLDYHTCQSFMVAASLGPRNRGKPWKKNR
jgi:hypothetical protein